MISTREDNIQEIQASDSAILDWTSKFLNLQAFVITKMAGKNLPKPVRFLLQSPAALLDLSIAYSETDPASTTRAQEAVLKTALQYGLYITLPEVTARIELLDIVGKAGSAFATGCNQLLGKASLLICPSKIPYEIMQLPAQGRNSLVEHVTYAISHFLNEKNSSHVTKQYNQYLTTQYLKDVDKSQKDQLTIDQIIVAAGISSHVEKLHQSGVLTPEEAAMNLLLARSQVHQILNLPHSDFVAPSISEHEMNKALKSEIAECQNYLSTTLQKSGFIYSPEEKLPILFLDSLPAFSLDKNVFFRAHPSKADVTQLTLPSAKPSTFSSIMPGFVGFSFLTGIQINPYNIAAFVINTVVNNALHELDDFLHDMIGRSKSKDDEQWSEHIGGMFDFTRGGWKSDKFRHLLNNSGCTTWLNPYNDGISGKLGCRSDTYLSTPSISHNTMFISGYKHIFQVTGYADEGVDAYLFVRCNGNVLIGRKQKLPTKKPGTVQVEFTPYGNGGGVLHGDIGVFISNPKPGQIFRLDKMVMAPVDYPGKYHGNRQVLASVKSPIGGLYNFSTGGDCGFMESSLSKVYVDNGKLVCKATPEACSIKTTPGIIRPVNLVPGKTHILEVKGMTQGRGKGKAYLYVRDAKETHYAVALPENESGTVYVEFVAPYQNKSISTCDVGVLFSGQSSDQSFVLDHIAVAPIDCAEKEIDGHPIAVPNVKSPIGGAYNFKTGGLCGFLGNCAKISTNESGQLYCDVRTNDPTAGFEKEINLVPGKKHIMQVKGMSHGQSKAWLWVHIDDEYKNDYFRHVALPQGKSDIVEMEFVAPNQNKSISKCRMGIFFSDAVANSNGQSMTIDHIAVAPIDCAEKEIDGHRIAIPNVKSPIGGAYNFKTGGLCGFLGNGAKISINESSGKLYCNVNTNDSTPGFEKEINLVPGQKHTFKVKGMSDGQNEAFLWVHIDDGGKNDYFRRVPLPKGKSDVVEMEFVAPDQGKSFSTCRMGILFSGNSYGQSFVLDEMIVAPIDCAVNEIDGHRVAIPDVTSAEEDVKKSFTLRKYHRL